MRLTTPFRLAQPHRLTTPSGPSVPGPIDPLRTGWASGAPGALELGVPDVGVEPDLQGSGLVQEVHDAGGTDGATSDWTPLRTLRVT